MQESRRETNHKIFVLSNRKLLASKAGIATKTAIQKFLIKKRAKLKNEFPTI